MNALANDQAERLTALLTTHPELGGITAGIYTGEQTSRRTTVSTDGLITDRAIMQDSPPDILLTNYKMLDQLLLRPKDAEIWRQSAESLQYIVLDEFHTYDGAQGTDVAMLLRRLGLTLKSYWTEGSRLSDADRARPLGRITPVATSATLGSGADPTVMLEFAHTVFGEVFPSYAVIGETRLSAQRWLADRGTILDQRYRPVEPVLAEATDRVDAAITAASDAGRDTNVALARAVLAELYEPVRAADTDHTLSDADLRVLSHDDAILDVLKGHPLIARLLDACTDPASLADLAAQVFPASRSGVHFLEHLLGLLSHVRATTGRGALSVDVHLWIRELSRVDRAVRATAGYRWADDGVTADHDEMYLPAIYCRHCGRLRLGCPARAHR